LVKLQTVPGRIGRNSARASSASRRRSDGARRFRLDAGATRVPHDAADFL